MERGPHAPLSIAYVSTFPPAHCGVGEYTRLLIAGLASASPGSRCIVIAERGAGERRVDAYSGARVVPGFRAREPASYKGVLEALEEVGGVDVLHVQHEYGIFGASKELFEVVDEAKSLGLARATVITLHTVLHPRAARGYVDGAPDFQRAVHEHFDAVVVHSFLQEFELQAQGVPPEAIERIPHGTAINPYAGAPKAKLAAELGLGGEVLRRPVLALVGFLRRDKGLDTLLEAADRVNHLKLAILVSGEVAEEGVREYLEGLRGDGLLLLDRFLSFDEMLMVAALADVLVLPYRDRPGEYSVSGVLHLSMGSLKPVVGSRVPRLVELYANAPQLTVRPGDAEGLAAKIAWVVSDYDAAAAYAGPLYSYAARTSWSRVARRHLSLYREVLAGKRRGRTA